MNEDKGRRPALKVVGSLFSFFGRDTSPSFSRSGVTNSEKCTTRIDVPVCESLENKLAALAAMSDKSKSEYARMILTVAVEGQWSWLQSIGVIPKNRDGN